MVSKMFLADCRRLEAKGVKFAPEDIIRLNALALKAKLAPSGFAVSHLQRVVFLDRFILREPTIGHELWLERVGEYLDYRARHNFRVAYCYALSRDCRDLPDPLKPRRVVRKMFAWAMRNVLPLTSETIADALDWVLFGADPTSGELAPPKDGEKTDLPRTIASEDSPTVGVIVGGLARRLPLTLEDAKRLTQSQLLEAICRADVRDGSISENARNDALGDYFRARDEIAARGAAAKAKGEGA